MVKILGRKSPTNLDVVQAVALGMTEPQTAEEAFNFTKASAPKVLSKRALSHLVRYEVN